MNHRPHMFAVLAALSMLAVGCAKKCPPLDPGMAGVELRLAAEPKRGVHTPSDDTYSGSDPGAIFPRVDYTDLPDVIVWVAPLDSTTAAATAASAPLTIALDFDDTGRKTAPPVQGVAVGSHVIFQNGSANVRSVYSVSEGNSFDLGSISPGAQAEFAVHSPGLIEVLSESQPAPVARLYAVPATAVRTLRSAETTCFNNLRPGDYLIGCWHERLPGEQRRITLTAEQRAEVTLSVSVNLLKPAP